MSQQPSVRTSPEAPQSSLPGARSALYIVHPPELAGQVIELVPGLIIGREGSVAPGEVASGAPFAVLSHPTVSRRHCLVRDAFGVPVLEDLGSSNGTRIDTLPLTIPGVLLPQSIVRIGSVLAVVDESPVQGAEWTAALPGIAPAIVRARDALRRAGSGLAPVLILGETGTGKERVAAEIHQQSGPFGTVREVQLRRALARARALAAVWPRTGRLHRCRRVTARAIRGGRVAAHCFWMRWASSTSSCRPSCCAFCKRGKYGRSAARTRYGWTYAWSLPPTAN